VIRPQPLVLEGKWMRGQPGLIEDRSSHRCDRQSVDRDDVFGRQPERLAYAARNGPMTATFMAQHLDHPLARAPEAVEGSRSLTTNRCASTGREHLKPKALVPRVRESRVDVQPGADSSKDSGSLAPVQLAVPPAPFEHLARREGTALRSGKPDEFSVQPSVQHDHQL
jgi:hypothetical protein